MLLSWLLLLVPLSLALAYAAPGASLGIFLTAALAIVALAEWIRRATEELARTAGPAVGGLLNVTFGNTAELVLALFVLAKGQSDVVKAQITGSIIGNALLGLGLAIVAGTWGREKLTFRREPAGHLSSLLILAMIGLLVPALFDYTERQIYFQAHPGRLNERLSVGVSLVLIAVYAANLVYTMATRRDAFALDKDALPPEWSPARSLAVLVAATAATAVEAELVAGALEETARRLRLTSLFLGLIVLAVLGNAAEYVAAVYFARRRQFGLVMGLTVGSTIQVALLVAPVLVLVSYVMGHPMDLVFANPLELIAVAAIAFVVNAIAHDGEATWFEGLLLVSVYVILGLAFYFVMP